MCSDNGDGLQGSIVVAFQCEANAGDVPAARCCKRQLAYQADRQGKGATASKYYTEEVDDNFQSSESTDRQLLRVCKERVHIAGKKKLTMEEELGYWQSSTSSVATAHAKKVDPLMKWRERGYNDIPYTGVERHPHEESRVKAADDHDQEYKEEACLTPRATEHCIFRPEILICPPPPRKKRRSTFPSLPDRNKVRKLLLGMPPFSSASSSADSDSSVQHMRIRRQFYAGGAVNPPDLHTFPACIKALFLHD